MIIINKQERLVVIPLTSKVKLADVAKKKRSGVASVTLYPGPNELFDGDWELIEALGLVADHIETGKIEVIGAEAVKETKTKDGKVTKKTAFKTTPFSELEPDEAVKLIKKTNDLKTIRKWKKKELREEIRLALAQREEKIEAFIKTGNKAAKKEDAED